MPVKSADGFPGIIYSEEISFFFQFSIHGLLKVGAEQFLHGVEDVGLACEVLTIGKSS